MRRCGRLAQWIGFALVMVTVLALTAYKAEQNATRRAHFQERNLKQEAAAELGREVVRRLQSAFMAGITLDEFTKTFGPPTPLHAKSDPTVADMTHSFFHDKSQRTFYLRFQDGKLLGLKSNFGLSDIDTGVVLDTPAYLRTESVRGSVLLVGELAWLVALVTGIWVPRLRRKAAVVLVVASLVCGLCWFLAPNYTPTLRGISSNDSLAIFVLLFLASLGFGAITAPPRDGDGDTRNGLHHIAAH